MNNPDRTVLVTGATGRQGGSVIRHMLAKGWKLRALTRKPDSAASRELAGGGIEVVAGDMEEAGTLGPALRGAYGVFSVQISGRSARRAKSNRERTWRMPLSKPALSTSCTAPWAARSAIPASTTGRVNGRSKSTSASSACQQPCSGRLRSWTIITSTRSRSRC